MATGPGSGTGILVSRTGKPEGPYISPLAEDKPLTNGIDATLFEDDDGKVYFTNGAGGVIHLMKSDMSGFDGDGHEIHVEINKSIPDGPTRLGHEGVSLFKANGKYYLGAADTFQGRYSAMCAISDNLFGPYSNVHEAVPCGAGGGYFKDKDGNWWCTIFGNDDQAPWREKPGLVRIEFADDGKIIVSKHQPEFVLQPTKP
jgi:beta-xylosidase